ncbi:hypothetical protein [Roseibacillus ishigakijimensis]|uniref:Uncharacterized protein n=1 Tax=Roseibacillus ishigakijimensis TaxID=454146 RepID=A0A934RS68_9BACT|nr:hypothetical protein [Roseibacillus ishigakijimensis]MBK1833541.1 hypothetical protein [Roseibacillus ishigakijimensis]
MSFLHQVVTFCLILLIGNPACCCQLPASPETSAVESSCPCQKKEQPEEGSDTGEDEGPIGHSCPCAAHPAELPDSPLALPAKPASEWTLAALEWQPEPRQQFPAVQVRGPSVPLPPPAVLTRSLWQVFRL